MSVYATAELSMDCDKCGDDLDEGDQIYCGKCAGITVAKGPREVSKIVEKVRWIGDELRDSKVDWRIVERVRELEAELLA